ncbi:hypothetical protein AAG570_002324 [Ranatra chinensis]|uniref:Major facilitator superfamily (MFS) profile domain-containing protein n=1 Tax=Ranatra chinensis TaxID=642074 RepID=A0ABD0YJH3_9HEMI
MVLYLLSFTGFLTSFMMRNDINLAIVAMVKTPPLQIDPNSSASDQPLYCYTTNVQFSPDNSTTILQGEFDWSNSVQSTIISSFYWCYVLAQVAGGVLTQRFGTKKIFGYSQLATALSSLLIPHAATFHYSLLIILRSIQGAASGLTWPAMYAMVGVWIPLIERSRFMSSFQGFSIGIGITYPLCGFIIAHFGWRPVFYVTGGLGCLWCLAWFLLAFDEPIKHPRISKQELRFIQENIDKTVVNGKGVKVPWTSILTSMPVIAIGVTTFGRIWVHYVFIISGPQYMKNILGFNIQKNGILSGAPFLCSYLSSVVFCYLADLLTSHKILTLTATRKLFTATSQVIPGVLVVMVGYLGCNVMVVLVLWFTAVTVITASYAGAMANVVDISPNFAGPVLAYAQTIHMTASFVSPMVAGFLLEDSRSLDDWRTVLWVSAIVSIATYSVYQIYGTSEVQSWNNVEGRREGFSGSLKGLEEGQEPLRKENKEEDDMKDEDEEEEEERVKTPKLD